MVLVPLWQQDKIQAFVEFRKHPNGVFVALKKGLRKGLRVQRNQRHLKIGPDARNGGPFKKACVDMLV